MEQVVFQSKGVPPAPGGGAPPPTLPEVQAPPPHGSIIPAKGEREWLRGPLSKEVSYRLIVSGDLGPREIGKLIKLLEAQKLVLQDDEDEDD